MGIEIRFVALVAAWTLASGAALAHGDAHPRSAPAKAEQTPFGIAGDPAKAVRTIAIDMSDAMRFSPAELEVRRGETIRFVVANRGALLHEMVIGTKAELVKHAELMRKHPGMEHDEPWMAHVAPGATGEIVWTWKAPGGINGWPAVADDLMLWPIGASNPSTLVALRLPR